MNKRWIWALALASGCVPAGDFSGQLAIETAGEVEETSALGLQFDDIAEAHRVPSDLLKALAFVETGLEPAVGEVEFDGQAPAFGYFGLRGDELARAAALVGKSVDEVIGDDSLGLQAAAALLSAYGDETGVPTAARQDPEAWRAAVAKWGALDEELRATFVHAVMAQLRDGAAVPMEDGSTLVIRKYALGELVDPTVEGVATTASGLGAAGVVWRPSPNHSSRNGSRVEMVVIHTCEGGYAGCASWLRNSRAQASAHYVVREDGREVSQLVDEARRAWHVAARYRKRLNGGQLAGRENQSVNDFSVGIEHGGFARQRSWPAGQISRSVDLVRDITRRHNIPRDRYHIVAHGRLQPESRTDPGPNWPWTSYLQSIAGGTSNPNPPTNNPPAGSGSVITVDNTTSGRFRASGTWELSSWASGKVGSNYRFRKAQATSDLAQYKVDVSRAGRYEVLIRVPGNGYNDDQPFFVHHRGGRAVVRRDISRAGGRWVSLGTYDFAAKDDWIVQVSCWTEGRGWIIADAVRLEPR